MSYQVKHISDFFDTWAPFSTQAEYDNSGQLVGSQKHNITGILTCLDVTEKVVHEAIRHGCNVIVAHHPVIFRKLSRIDPDTDQGSLLYKLIRHDIAVLAVHTNLDAARDGVSFVLADQLSLQDQEFLSWHDETKSHGYGVVGNLANEMSAADFLELVCKNLGTNAVRFSGGQDGARVKRVAVCGGTGISLAAAASQKGAHAFVTADIKYHEYFDFPALLKVDAGHYETEFPIAEHLKNRLFKAFPDLEVHSVTTRTNPMLIHVSKDFRPSSST
jgi:dinuclear metal center YbgI/SA1388 family protein